MSIVFQAVQWIAETGWATALRESEIAFPVIQTFHILGLGLLAGTVAIVDLRLLGVVLARQPASLVARQFLPLTWAGFAVMAISGSLLFAAQAEHIWENNFLRAKFVLLILAGINMIVFHATSYRHIEAWGEVDHPVPATVRVAAAASLILWTGIIAAGRLIAYFS